MMAEDRRAHTTGRGSLGFGVRFAYGIGDVGNNIFIVASGLFLLYFMTDVLSIEPSLAGLALLFPKIWDVISDPLMGFLSDRTKTSIGRRRPYLLVSAVPFGLSFLFLFWAPTYASEGARTLHVGLMFAIACTMFTVYNVPYASMVAEMTDDYHERTALTSFRMMAASLGVLLAGGLAMPLVAAGGGGAPGYRFMGLTLGIAVAGFCLVAFFGTRRAPFRETASTPIPFGEQLRIAARNRPFIWLMLSYLLQSLGMGVLMAGLIYYVRFVMKLPESAMATIFPLLLVTAIAVMPLWVRVGRALGKIRAYRIGLVLLTLTLASLYLTPPGTAALFYAQIAFLGIGFSSFQLFPFAMLPDTVEYDEVRSGMRREGIFSGFWSSGQKMAYSVGPTIVGFALSLSGFIPGSSEQPSSVSAGIRIAFCLLPPAMVLLSFVPFSRYGLTEEAFEQLRGAKGTGR